MSILIVILIISFLIIIHELGHFIVAKKNKIRVEEFGFGYPPKLCKLFRWKGTEFSLNAIPFGGFVRLEGEEGPEEDESEEPGTTRPHQAGFKVKSKVSKDGWAPFYLKSQLQKIAVIMAGPATNFFYGVLAFSVIFSIMGIPSSLEGQARIAYVAPGSPAQQAGLPTEVNIKALRSGEELYKVTNIEEIRDVISQHQGKEVTVITTGSCEGLKCEDINQEFIVYLRTDEETPAGEGTVGIGFADFYYKHYSMIEKPFRAAAYGLKEALTLGVLVLGALGSIIVDLIRGAGVPQDVAGPVGIVHYAYKNDLAAENILSLVGFSAMLSVNLAIMNLLPIPVLDGGRALFIFLENILGPRLIKKIEGIANYSGFAFLFALIMLITARDIWRIISG